LNNINENIISERSNELDKKINLKNEKEIYSNENLNLG